MLNWRHTFTVALLALVANSADVRATERQEAGPKEIDNVGIDEKLGAAIPQNLIFTEGTSAPTTLAHYFQNGRPVILTLNYSSCPMLCSLQLDGFVDALKQVALTIGKDYDIVTVSIDPDETADRTQGFKDKYVRQYERPEAAAGWHFLRGDEKNIRALADSVGFRYAYVPERKEYAHAAGLMVLSPKGVVTRYLYGVMHEARDIRLALVEGANGKVGTTVDRILLYCFHYDATAGKYAPVAANIMRLGGALTVLIFGSFLGLYWLKDARKPRISLS